MTSLSVNPTIPGTITMSCSNCRGYGITAGYMGDPVDCRECGGGGVVKARDSRGRFLPFRPAENS